MDSRPFDEVLRSLRESDWSGSLLRPLCARGGLDFGRDDPRIIDGRGSSVTVAHVRCTEAMRARVERAAARSARARALGDRALEEIKVLFTLAGYRTTYW